MRHRVGHVSWVHVPAHRGAVVEAADLLGGEDLVPAFRAEGHRLEADQNAALQGSVVDGDLPQPLQIEAGGKERGLDRQQY